MNSENIESSPSILDETDKFLRISNKRIDTVENLSQDFEELDGSDENKKFNPFDHLYLASPLKEFGRVMKRSRTEGRSMSIFKRLKDITTEIVYNDVLIKGIGGRDRELTREDTGEKVEGSKTNRGQSEGRNILKRFVEGKFKEITGGEYGFTNIGASGIDAQTSEELAEKGLRTRKRIFAGKLRSDTKVGTDTGMKKISELSEKNQDQTIEMWAMRCSYRLRDLRFAFGDLKDKQLRPYGFRRNLSNLYYDESDKSIKRHGKPAYKNNEEINLIFKSLKDIIKNRVSTDEDERFRNLEKITNESGFFSEYLKSFSSVLGEQVGIMYKLGAFSKDSMLNDQNISLLAEIVDHDVTGINESTKNDGNAIFKQINLTYNSLLGMLSDFMTFQKLPDDFNPKEILDNFINGIVNKLDTDDRDLLCKALAKIDHSDYVDPNITEEEKRLNNYQLIITESENILREIEQDHSLEGSSTLYNKENQAKQIDRYREYQNNVRKRISNLKNNKLEPVSGKIVDARYIFDEEKGKNIYLISELRKRAQEKIAA